MDNLPNNRELAAFTREALTALPIPWTDLVVHNRHNRHNPDSFDCVVELFDPEDRNFITSQDRIQNRVLTQSDVPGGTVLSEVSFARHYDRPTHQVMWVFNPILSRDRNKGLLVVQVEDAGPSGAMAMDHWVYMERNESSGWQRRPIPAHLRSRLYLDDETGGGPLTADGDVEGRS